VNVVVFVGGGLTVGDAPTMLALLCAALNLIWLWMSLKANRLAAQPRPLPITGQAATDQIKTS
jgi:hypothetical protein